MQAIMAHDKNVKKQGTTMFVIGMWSSWIFNWKDLHIVAYHLPRGSNVQWREDMSGGLPRARVSIPTIQKHLALLSTFTYDTVDRDNIFAYIITN